MNYNLQRKRSKRTALTAPRDVEAVRFHRGMVRHIRYSGELDVRRPCPALRLDEETREWIKDENPYAMVSMLSRLQEVIERGIRCREIHW